MKLFTHINQFPPLPAFDRQLKLASFFNRIQHTTMRAACSTTSACVRPTLEELSEALQLTNSPPSASPAALTRVQAALTAASSAHQPEQLRR